MEETEIGMGNGKLKRKMERVVITPSIAHAHIITHRKLNGRHNYTCTCSG